MARARDERRASPRTDEEEAEGLTDMLAESALSSASLFSLGAAFTDDSSQGDALLGSYFFIAAQSHAEAELRAHPLPDTAGEVARNVLRGLVSPMMRQRRYDLLCRVYSALGRCEAVGSSEQYRARLKFADMLLECHQGAEALKELDALIVDVNDGFYASANEKDIANLRWQICCQIGDLENGVDYLRRAVQRHQGSRFELRLRETLVYALLATGRIDEAEREYRVFSGSADLSQDQRSKLEEELALAKWRKAHSGSPDAPHAGTKSN